MLKGISIIVCCYNSEKRLPETLQYIANQTGCDDLNIQVIIVDNASADQTKNVAIKEWEKYNLPNYTFTIVEEFKPGLSSAREKGLTESIYNYIVFCDDDNWLEENYLTTVYQLFEGFPNTAVLGGLGEPAFSSDTVIPVWLDTYYNSYAVGKIHPKECIVDSVQGAGMCIRKDVYLNIFKIFGPLLLSGRKGKKLSAGEDSEICIRIRLIGYQVLYSPDLKFKHFLPANRLTWSYLLKLHKGFARSFVILDIYKKALNKEEIGSFYWLRKSVYNFLLFTKYLVLYLPNLLSKTKYKREEILLSNWFIFSTNYFTYNFKVNKIYNQITNAIKNATI
ncbi:MAG: glycosyltransferase [Pedobacter sp.]|jgi:glycosyltransferase involved in cell wall biosynthesis|uniref:glycosyltransferase n=1 Tax=Pedobacter sp. TaxID=1411316 RepID=UPI0035629DA7